MNKDISLVEFLNTIPWMTILSEELDEKFAFEKLVLSAEDKSTADIMLEIKQHFSNTEPKFMSYHEDLGMMCLFEDYYFAVTVTRAYNGDFMVTKTINQLLFQ